MDDDIGRRMKGCVCPHSKTELMRASSTRLLRVIGSEVLKVKRKTSNTSSNTWGLSGLIENKENKNNENKENENKERSINNEDT
uniref:Uncharacterized protein n=1 Tax=Pristionchus pacificus TaxID=54126 RepID=A0A2A6B9Z1_PRIPA|eukprot:PDM62683.1 hypothetical protein PRIPAC_49898 [Pristionchus pacificus]